MRLSPLLLVLFLAACGPTTAPTETPTPTVTAAPTPEAPPADCSALVADYLAAREALNHCERDEDCAQFWPGVCPQGAWYGHVQGDHASVSAATEALTSSCVLPECEPPRRLGMARCQDGRCIEGRTPPRPDGFGDCWDTRITWTRIGRNDGDSYPHLQGITPLFGVGVPAPGSLRVSADVACTDCAIHLSERNPGMGSPVEGLAFTPASRQPSALGRWIHREFPVATEPHYLAVIGGEQASMRVWIELLDEQGRPMEPDRRGVTHQRTCED